MSWGVATQNGVSVSLASIVSLSAGVTEFSPADLFTGGVQGAWYDPSDYSTLFQDSAGTTPVTAVEQPVGLMLDKSQGLVLGPELVTNGGPFTNTTGWTGNGATLSVVSGALRFTTTAAYGGGYIAFSTVVGATYRFSFTIPSTARGRFGTTMSNGDLFPSTGGTVSGSFRATSTTSYFSVFDNTGATVSTFDLTVVSVKELPGNHASQATAASRPVLRARYNLLTYSEQFDNAAWAKTGMLAFGSGSVVNATTAPDGTTTADLLTPDTTSSTKAVRLVVTGAGANTWSFYAKANGYTKVGIWDYATSGAYAAFLLSGAGSVLDSGTGASNATITSVGNGWYRCSFTATVTGSLGFSMQVLSPSYTTGSVNSAWTSNGTDGVYLWGAMLNTGSSAGTYQRIAAATDYATAGFLPYLALSTDDSFATNSINFTATDKMSVCVGVTKNSDTTGFGIICELSGNTSIANPGSFGLFAPATGGTPSYHVGLARSAASLEDLTTYAAPITNVIFVGFDFAGASRATAIIPRVNGSTPTISGGANVAPGTGNFGNYPLYIGRRAGSSLPLEGRIYQMVVCGKTLSASELASTEAYVNSKTGAY